jgi:hypothetical protein
MDNEIINSPEQEDYQKWLQHFKKHIDHCYSQAEQEFRLPQQANHSGHSDHFEDRAFYGWLLDRWEELEILSNREELEEYVDKLLAATTEGPIRVYAERFRSELSNN